MWTPILAAVHVDAINIFNITLIGVNLRTGKKLLFTLVLFAAVFLLRAAALWLVRRVLAGQPESSGRFWSRQGVQLVTAIVLLLGILSIWIDKGTNLTTGLGLVSAGLAFALQQVITAVAGYFVILRGDVFTVGDRITMGGVRGDVIRLGFIKTTVMEMGQPPSVQAADPAVWVHSRQYTGRLVTVSNGKIFDDPVYNYSRDFPYLWEEIALPISYDDDRVKAEEILLAAARTHAQPVAEMCQGALSEMQKRYAVQNADLEPAVYYRLTDNWLELSLRFVVPDHGIRGVKDKMSRDILCGLDEAGIGIASGTYDIVGLPPIRVVAEPGQGQDGDGRPGDPRAALPGQQPAALS